MHQKNLLHLFCALVFCFFLPACANYKINYGKANRDWEANAAAIPVKHPVEHTVFLMGDAGGSPDGGLAPALQLLQKKLAAASENSSVIFLGDNIYPVGMPSKSKKQKRAQAEHRLDAQLATLKDFKGRPLFIPGNHDWQKYGLKGLKRQEKYVEKKLNAGIEDEEDWQNYFLPDDGCAGPELIEVNDKLAIIVIDSQWWLNDWDKEPKLNDGCESKSRFVFSFLFEEMVRKNRNKNVIVAMHHPLFSGGT
ncbi:MAG: metallophosphoesterase, partial [Bacteroidota bacterium]